MVPGEANNVLFGPCTATLSSADKIFQYMNNSTFFSFYDQFQSRPQTKNASCLSCQQERDDTWIPL